MASDRGAPRRRAARRLSAGLVAGLLALALSGCQRGPTITGDFEGPRGPGPGNQSILAFQQIFAGETHSCALVNSGKALCWGSAGDLGDTSMEDQDTPVRVEGPQTFGHLDASAFTCGTTTNQQAWCWGVNTKGRLGDGTTEYRPFPTEVATASRLRQITTGTQHACGITTDDRLLCWGTNIDGQLGAHPDTMSVLPVELAPMTRFRSVDAGGLRTCAVEDGGATVCWGDGLGLGQTEIQGGIAFEHLTVGGQHVCGLDAEGRAWCFGTNLEGQLGDGSFDSTPITGPPVPVLTEERFVGISAGESHTCAITEEGAGWCWGSDSLGQLGDGGSGSTPFGGDPTRNNLPTLVITENSFIDFTTITAGRWTSCATTANGRGFCWGRGTGSGSIPDSTVPVEIGF
ncbi:MAG: hypothetical protein R3195_13095 [Gemmatimonadota bacterium]|nr:hypothetical protein [Gemmatimonadota bacterium]